MAIKIKLKNSVTQNAVPTGTHLPEVGELAVNANINSIGGYMRASDNSIIKIFGPGSVSTPAASTTVSGISELATSAETTTGTDTARVCTPAGVKAVTDAERTTSNSTYLAKAGGTLTGVLAATAGSNSAASIHFGDTDSGLFGGTNTVSLTAGGTENLSVISSRVNIHTKLGIATGTPSTMLHITSASSDHVQLHHTGNSGYARIVTANNNAIKLLADPTNAATGSTAIEFAVGGNEAARIDGSKRLLVASSSGRTIWGASPKIQLESTDSNTSFSLIRNQSNNGGPWIALCKSRGANNGSHTIVQDGDSLGSINWFGADGVDLASTSAEIRAEIDGTPGENDLPGKLVFKTTADGASSPTTRLTIGSDGNSVFTGTATFAGGICNGSFTVSSTEPRIYLTDTNSNSDFEIRNVDGNFRIFDSTETRNCLSIDSAGAVQLAGNLGIGCAPSRELHVKGLDVALRLESTAATGRIGTEFYDTSAQKGFFGYPSSGNDNMCIQQSENADFYIYVNGSTRMNITSTGNLEKTGGGSYFGLNSNGYYAKQENYDNTGGKSYWFDGASGNSNIVTSVDGQTGTIYTSSQIKIARASAYASSNADELIVGNEATNTDQGITILSHTSKSGTIYFGDGDNPNGHSRGQFRYDHGEDAFIFATAGGTEDLRLKDRRLLLGTTTEGNESADDLTIATTGNTGITIRSGANNNGSLFFSDTTSGADEYRGFVQYDQQNDNLKLGCATEAIVWLHADKKLSVGEDSVGYGQWAFLNSGSSGADATGGDTGLTIRSDTGPTNNSVVSNGDWTLKLNNNAYAGTGVSGNTGTVVKLLFNGATSNGWNAYGAMGLDVQGQSGGKGDLFFNTGGEANGNTRLRISYQGKVIMGTATDTTDTSERFFVDGSGASDHCGLGIKTNNPTYDGFIAFHDTDANGQGAIRYNHSQDRMKFRTGGNNERICLDSDGLKFHGDTAAANALNDYEEGQFEPIFKYLDGSSVWQTCTFTNNLDYTHGRYVKVGNIVHGWYYTGFCSMGSAANNRPVQIAGLPYPFKNGEPYYGGTFLFTHCDMFSDGTNPIEVNTGYANYSQSYFAPMRSSGSNNLNGASWNTSGNYMMVSFTYQTD